MRTRKLVELNGVSKYFCDFCALENVSLTLEKGKVTALIGPNGAGKTTLMKLISFVGNFDSGEYFFDGQKLPYHKARKEFGSRVGLVSDPLSLYPYMTGLEYLLFCARLQGLSNRAVDEVNKVVKTLSIESFIKKRISTMSKGMRQKIAIAQAILGDSVCLVLDEPASGLDPISKIEFREVIQGLKEKRAILLSSHNLNELEFLADSIVLINHGKIVFSGTLNEMNDKYQTSPAFVFEIDKARMDTKFLEDIQGVSNLKTIEDKMIFQFTESLDYKLLDLEQRLVQHQMPIVAITPQKSSLEELFLRELNHE